MVYVRDLEGRGRKENRKAHKETKEKRDNRLGSPELQSLHSQLRSLRGNSCKPAGGSQNHQRLFLAQD